MNWDHMQADWEQLKGKLRAKWGKLTDDDLEMIRGKRDVLVGKLRERYAEKKERIEAEVDAWIASL
jgi:uncharacterized protein YjbJ (UPF0337 family)